MNPRALNSSLQSQYLPNATIQLLLDQLMVERWNWSSMYESYYGECQPEECSYTYETKNDAIYIITTVIGLFGGLITVLKLVISQIFMRALAFIQRKRRIVPEFPVRTGSTACPAQCTMEDLDSWTRFLVYILCIRLRCQYHVKFGIINFYVVRRRIKLLCVSETS